MACVCCHYEMNEVLKLEVIASPYTCYKIFSFYIDNPILELCE